MGKINSIIYLMELFLRYKRVFLWYDILEVEFDLLELIFGDLLYLYYVVFG